LLSMVHDLYAQVHSLALNRDFEQLETRVDMLSRCLEIRPRHEGEGNAHLRADVSHRSTALEEARGPLGQPRTDWGVESPTPFRSWDTSHATDPREPGGTCIGARGASYFADGESPSTTTRDRGACARSAVTPEGVRGSVRCVQEEGGLPTRLEAGL
jgi:hypothetical protein